MQYFVSVSDKLSFAQASRELYISQQALSKSIISLENELGVKLFERLSSGVELTQYGEALLPSASGIINLIKGISDNMNRIKLEQMKIVHFAMTNGVEEIVTADLIRKWTQLYPEYEISTTSTTDKEIEKNLLAGKIEFAIVGSLGSNPMLEYELICQTEASLVVPKSNPLSKRDIVSITDLKKEHLLLNSNDYYCRNRLNDLCRLSGFLPKISFETPDSHYLSRLVACGQGICLCPDTLKLYYRDPNIVIVPFERNLDIFAITFATRKGAVHSLGTKIFRSFFIEETNMLRNTTEPCAVKP